MYPNMIEILFIFKDKTETRVFLPENIAQEWFNDKKTMKAISKFGVAYFIGIKNE